MAASTSLTADEPIREHHPLCACLPDVRRLRRVGYLRGPAPAGLDCLSPVLLVCDGCSGRLVLPCQTSRASRCGSCSARYKRRLTRVAGHRSSGSGLPFGYLLTLTAPSFREHRRFIPGRRGDHGPCASGCRSGSPDVATWNADASACWNRLRLALSRGQIGDARGSSLVASASPRLEFFRVVEVQDGKRRADGVGRGALHLHVIIWSREPLVVGQVHALAVAAGFGCSVRLDPITSARGARHAEYVAKYATKAADQRSAVPWRRVSEVVNPHTGEAEDLVDVDASYRTWSASRGWGITMREIRELLRAHVARAADAAPSDQQEPATAAPPADCPEPAD